MKRFLIKVGTDWCGMDDIFRAQADKEEDLTDLIQELAYDNAESYGISRYIAAANDFDYETMDESDWDHLWAEVDESDYYYGHAEEFEGTEEEWDDYGGEIYEC